MRAWIAAAALLAAWPAWAQEDATGTLTVAGTGRVAMAPDLARIRMGVGAEADSAGAAAAALSADLGPVIEGLAEAGIAASDIQTSTLQIGPVYAEDSTRPGDRPEIAGYRAESLVTVTLREIGRVGEILDAALGDGANRLEGISFALSEPQPARDAALAAAVADAMRKAQIASDAAGRTLGPIRSLTEGGGGGPSPEMMRMSATADMPVAPGEVEATAEVEITWSLGD